MHSTAVKESKSENGVKHANSSFFKKTGEEAFFKPAVFSGVIQPKLTVSPPNDPSEKEADEMAEQVMRMAEPSVQRKCAACDDEEKKPVQRKVAPSDIQKEGNDHIVNDNLSERLLSLKGTGAALPETTKDFMEGSFGANFSGVRIHTGEDAISMNRDLQSHAFTFGNDIYFNDGKFDPNSSSGKQLLAHELTHTIQQGAADTLQRQSVPPATPAAAPAPAQAATTATPPVSAPAPSEFQISQVSQSSEASMIFFDVNSTGLNMDQRTKIMFYAGPPNPLTGNVTLRGYISEDEPARLAQERIDAVKREFNSYTNPTAVPPTFTDDPQPATGEGRIDYRHVRAVEIVLPGQVSSTPNCSTSPKQVACSQTTELAFQAAVAEARRHITTALGKLRASPRDAATNTLLDSYFGQGVAGNGAAVLPTLIHNIELISQQIGRIRDARHHQCGTLCDSICSSGAIAYNSDVGNAATYTVCPVFINLDLPNRYRNMIHECAHGTVGLAAGGAGTDDFAYRHERLINLVAPSVALQNSDSYSLLIMYLANPSFVTQHPATDDLSAVTNTAERGPVALAIANLEKWMTFAQQETSTLYGVINVSKPPATAWSNSYYVTTMQIWAANFSQLTTPPLLPNTNDQITVAGMHDRLVSMRNAIRNNLTFTRLSTGNTQWEYRLGTHVDVGDNFFAAATPPAQALLLLEAIVHANNEIPLSSEPGYVHSIDRIRQRH